MVEAPGAAELVGAGDGVRFAIQIPRELSFFRVVLLVFIRLVRSLLTEVFMIIGRGLLNPLGCHLWKSGLSRLATNVLNVELHRRLQWEFHLGGGLG
jgi:hypothetical protein